MIPTPRIRTNLQVRPDLVPMVGVMLVLLVTYLVMVPALLTGFEPILPRVVHATVYPESPTDVTLGIDRDGSYYLNKRPIRETAVAADLRRTFQTRPGEYVLYVWADRDVDYGLVRSAMDLGAASGARVIGVIVWDSTAR